MLWEYLDQFCKELTIDTPKKNESKSYLLKIAGESLKVVDLDPGVSMYAPICEVPKRKKEELFIYLMRANLLGQGTGSCRIGIDANEKFLTLCLGFPYELNYQTFKETVEDFVNYVIYWREEVTKFENVESVF